MKKGIFFPYLLILFLAACSDHDYEYPDVITEVIDVQTDHTGKADCLITDEGNRWTIQSRSGLDGLEPDTIYRTISMYAPVSSSGHTEREAKVYRVQLVTSPRPCAEAKFKEIKTDPVAIQSIWRSGNYLNLILQVKVKDQQHKFHFVENKLEKHEDGTQSLYLTLYHDRNNDMEAFNQRTVLSVPLWTYAETLHKGDEIIFSLNTYTEGMTTRRFTY